MSDLEIIKEILLRHKGRKNAIRSKEISSLLGLPLEDTQFVTRMLIRKVCEAFELPVISSSEGYFIPENEKELKKYNLEMQKRIDGIESTRRKINANYNKWVKGRT